MDRWRPIARIEECPIGRGHYVEVDGHELAVFHLADPERFVVTRNSCPHAGGNLAAGEVRPPTVTCPWHHWEFNLDTGACVLSDSARLTRFETRVEDGQVWALLPDRAPRPAVE